MRTVKVVATVLLLGLGAVSASGATPANFAPTLTTKVLLPSDYDDITAIAASGTSWLVTGNVDQNTITDSKLFPSEASKGGSDGYVAMLDPALKLVWSHRFGTAHDDVATSITRDSSGVIWSIGVTSKQAQPIASTSPTATLSPTSPTATPIPTANPDGVVPVTSPSPALVADQLLVSSWSNSGELLSQNLYPINDGVAIDPSAVVAAKSGIYVVGTAVNALTGTSRGFYLAVAADGKAGQVHWIGTKSVLLNGAALLQNGSLVVVGSIAEPLKGKPAIGPEDAYLVIVNPVTGAILRSMRSGNKSVNRTWASVSADRHGNLLAVGPAIGSKKEVVATAFGATGLVKFSLRLVGPALGTQVAIPAPSGASGAIVVATRRPGRSGIESYLAPIGANGQLLRPAYLAGRAGAGLLAAAAGKGYLLASGDGGSFSLTWFAPRSGK